MAVVNLGNGDDIWEAFQQGLGFQSNTINGNGGDDLIVSGSLNDTVDGGDGDDIIFGVSGNDTINGGNGDDQIDGGNGSDTIAGGAGNDTYVLDLSGAEVGQDTITDDNGTLLVGSTSFNPTTGEINTTAYQIAGNATAVSGVANTYELTLQDTDGNAVTYRFEWNGTNGTDLAIWQADVSRAQNSVTIKNFNNDTFGLHIGNAVVNQPPVAVNDSATVVEDHSIVINVLANDTDDGSIDPTTVSIGTNPAHGTVSVNATTGAITYVPTADYHGADSFTYNVLDNNGEVSNVATVTLNVTDDLITLTENPDFFEAFSIGRGNDNLEINALGGNDVVITGFGNDVVDGGAGNDTLYTYNGNDNVTGGAGNDAIEAGSGINVVAGGADADTYILGFAGTGTTQITDDNGTLFIGTINTQTGQPEGVALAGDATQQSAGVYTITSNGHNYSLAWTGTDLVITQTDGTNPHVVTVKDYVNGTFGLNLTTPDDNQAPVAIDDNATVVENHSVVIDVLGNDTDSDGTVNATTVAVVDNPAHGAVVINPTTGAITYTPTADFVGADSFTYTVLDDHGQISNHATVNLTVQDSGSVDGISLTEGNDTWSAVEHGLYHESIVLNALGGDDNIIGGGQDDLIDGGAGNDTINSSWGEDTISGGEGNDTLRGSWDDDLISGNNGNDDIRGNWGNDNLNGGDGNDTIHGGWGNDFIFGDNGDDTIHGGFGADTLTGGAGADTFTFESSSESETGFGSDLILDFTQGQDVLMLNGSIAHALTDLTIATSAGQTVITDLDSSFKVTLDGTYNLTESDFVFA